MNLRIIRERLHDKNVICYIDGIEGEKFVRKYSDIINIAGYFTLANDINIDSIEKYSLKDVLKRENIYIILCCDNPKNNAKVWNILCDDFSYIEDVAEQDIVSAVLEGKYDMMLMIGVCQQKWVSYALNHITDFNKKNICKYIFFSYLEQKSYKRMFEKLIEYSSWFIRIKTLIIKGEVNLWLDNICGKYSDRIYNMPFVNFSAMYPQISWKSSGTNSMMHEYYFESLQYPNIKMRSLLYKDENVLALINEMRSSEDILKAIMDENYYSKESMERRIAITFKEMEIVERQCQINVKDWIFDNYRTKQLYLDAVHFSDALIFQYCREIMRRCNIEYSNFEEFDIIQTQGKLHKTEYLNEVPIYPSVVKHLGLKWIDDKKLYNCSRASDYKKLSFKDAMLDYIEYVKLGKQMSYYI